VRLNSIPVFFPFTFDHPSVSFALMEKPFNLMYLFEVAPIEIVDEIG